MQVNHIVALSGGKDSTAMALRLMEVEPRDYQFVCTPTGDELPEMIAHWKKLGDLLGKPILPVTNGKSLQGLIRDQTMLPNHRARWCTRMLKLEPYYRWLATMRPAVSYVGLRADESGRPGMNFPEDEGIQVRFPMQEWGWTVQDIFAYLDQRGVKVPARTDCARCYHQTLGEWWRLWKLAPEIYEEALQQEEWVSSERGETYTFRNPQRDNWPAGLRDLRAEFELGKIPPRTVQQIDAFHGEQRRSMCRVCSL